MFRMPGIFAIALLLNVAAFGQSLGDVARANREQQQARQAAGTTPKVITNKDLPFDPSGAPGSTAPSQPVNRASEDRASDQRFAQERLAQQRAAEQWRARIQAQENKVAELQERVDRLNASLHPAGGVQYEGPHNRYQARQMERLAQMQEMLDQQKQRLYTMQEEARRAGMHTSTYDP